MKNNFYYKGFPNNLRIARRIVENDETQEKIYSLIKKIKTSQKNKNNFLNSYLSNSKLIGKL